MADFVPIIIPPVKSNGDYNVTVKTKNCKTNILRLFAKKFPFSGNDKLYELPIRKNGITRFKLDPHHYYCYATFLHVSEVATVEIEAITSATPSTQPFPIPAHSAPVAENGRVDFSIIF